LLADFWYFLTAISSAASFERDVSLIFSVSPLHDEINNIINKEASEFLNREKVLCMVN